MENWQLAAHEAPSPLREMELKKAKQFPNGELTGHHGRGGGAAGSL